MGMRLSGSFFADIKDERSGSGRNGQSKKYAASERLLVEADTMLELVQLPWLMASQVSSSNFNNFGWYSDRYGPIRHVGQYDRICADPGVGADAN